MDLKGTGEVSKVYTAQSARVSSRAEYKQEIIKLYLYLYVISNINKYLYKLSYNIFNILVI